MPKKSNWNIQNPPKFSKNAIKEFNSFEAKEKKRIQKLIRSIYLDGLLEGIGKPEYLKHIKSYSRRIDTENRLIYSIDLEGNLCIESLIGHYI